MDTNRSSNDDSLRARAVALREEGWNNRQIRAELGLSGWKLTQLFQGHVERAHENLATRAKPELRAQARELREQGWGYPAIARKLRVSKSSLSLWLRDLPTPEVYHPGEPPNGWTAEEWADFCAQRQEIYRQRKAEERRQQLIDAASEVGELTDRELLLVGAMTYWCEGSKSKPWRRQNQVQLINSDPLLIGLFLRFLERNGYGVDQLTFTLHIHETADVEEAMSYWIDVTGAGREQFRKPVIKKHNPKTSRRKCGDHYHGALIVYVKKSAKLYRRIEGWARAAMMGSERAIGDIQGNEEPPW